MAAGLGFKTFTTGEVLTAADTNGYLMQGVLVFASAAARDAAITSPQEGQCCYLKDTDAVLTYSGSAWVGFDDSNAIQNTIVDAKGDLITATAADTPARLAVGTNGQTLVADSTAATGLKWAAASSGALTKITTASFSAVATTGTTFDGVFTSTYDNYVVIMDNIFSTTSSALQFQTRLAGSTQSAGYYGSITHGNTVVSTSAAASFSTGTIGTNALGSRYAANWTIYRNNSLPSWTLNAYCGAGYLDATFGGGHNNNIAASGFDGFILSAASGNISGTATVYGVQK